MPLGIVNPWEQQQAMAWSRQWDQTGYLAVLPILLAYPYSHSGAPILFALALVLNLIAPWIVVGWQGVAPARMKRQPIAVMSVIDITRGQQAYLEMCPLAPVLAISIIVNQERP